MGQGLKKSMPVKYVCMILQFEQVTLFLLCAIFVFLPIQQAVQQILSPNNIECVRSCDQQPYLFIERKESISIKKE